MKKITKNTKFSEILEEYPETAEVFFEKGMHCLGCSMSQIETIEQGALAHGINPDDLIKELNKKIKKIK